MSAQKPDFTGHQWYFILSFCTMNLIIPLSLDITDINAKEKNHNTNVEVTARCKNKNKDKNIYTSYQI